ncbi:precorrin-3B synthase [Methylobacterium gnaphalii]|uniref:Nitrite/Sulfite reductase ferredoxin-like domain-containing protein n=1 Tax=Methylobacterium gnaphalii TaxID=1010610 RepID=A0A512JL11_9HYPH|nr:precorrin-3B synthase [Methylobacterium gnaphalii]GEP10582.1 hypothetical protein MGN01_24270 [Methylobacterium gnaphalii]GJD69145.1 hypothetical protein MMMDOFMJ_2071 [Methylobacterium gnaphalii]GLS47854.1 hypothetical protein GCM10007885_06980 [Methylobacterium gnaphalii]
MSVARRQPPAEASRRGWCPSLARPMPTGDGLLARVHPPLGILSATQLRAVAEGARRYGNGHIDITARGNLQIRGVSEETACPLAAHLTAAGLGDVRADGGPLRLTLTSPLADCDSDALIDATAMAQAIEAVGLTIHGLPAKTLVAIESGGRWGLGAMEPDLFVRPIGRNRVVIGLATDMGPLWCDDIAADDAPAAMDRALTAFAATGRRRMHDLDDAERERVAGAARGAALTPLPAAHREEHGWDEPIDAPAPGTIPLTSDTVAIVVEAPFGRSTAEGLDAAAGLLPAETMPHHSQPNSRHSGAAQPNPTSTTEHEARCGISDGLPAPGEAWNDEEFGGCNGIELTASRGLVLVLPRAMATAARDALAAAGFITDPADPRRAIAACPGAPACASGTTPVPEHATRLAQAFAPFAARGLTAHVSGCAKGCAHPRPASLTLVGEGGHYRIVLDGTPGDGGQAPCLTFEAALDRVRRAVPARSLAGAFPS